MRIGSVILQYVKVMIITDFIRNFVKLLFLKVSIGSFSEPSERASIMMVFTIFLAFSLCHIKVMMAGTT